jgi:hypothetical protein
MQPMQCGFHARAQAAMVTGVGLCAVLNLLSDSRGILLESLKTRR